MSNFLKSIAIATLCMTVFQNCGSGFMGAQQDEINSSLISSGSSDSGVRSETETLMREFNQLGGPTISEANMSTAEKSQTDAINIGKSFNGAKFGIFYSLWHCPYSQGLGPLQPPDMTAIEKISNYGTRIRTYEAYLKSGLTQFWQDQPVAGYYCINNTNRGRAVARLHAMQLRDMGIDFIIADFTNNALSPNSIDKNNPNSCHHQTVYNMLKSPTAASPLTSACIGYDTSSNSKAILESFKILLEEWSKVSGAPKIVPWVPMTRTYAANTAVLTGQMKHGYDLMVAEIIKRLMDGTTVKNKFKDLVLKTPDTNNKPLMLNTVNHLFPEDTVEVSRVRNSGFHVENAWARFPNKEELELDLPFLKQRQVLGTLMSQQSPHYKDHRTLLWKSLISNSNLRSVVEIVPQESIESYLARVKTVLQNTNVSNEDKNIIKAELGRSAQLVQAFFWHSTDITKMWRWRAPCRNPKAFKAGNATGVCDQRVSQDGKVVNLSTAFEWVSFAEENTSIPQKGGRVFERYFETFENNYADTAKFVILDSWNEWVSPFRRCNFNEAAPLKVGTSDQKMTFVGGARATNTNVNQTSQNFVNRSLASVSLQQVYSGIDNVNLTSIDNLLDPIEYWSGSEVSSRVNTICKDMSSTEAGASFRWLRDSNNNRVRPHFHHHWVGEYRSDIEPGVNSGSAMYWRITNRILGYKRTH